MEQLLHEILFEIKTIKQDIQLIKNKLDKVSNSCNEMDNHISFIMKVYETLKNPISIISNFSYKKLSINN